jgi:single-stranded-DNA-specific exonuclease
MSSETSRSFSRKWTSRENIALGQDDRFVRADVPLFVQRLLRARNISKEEVDQLLHPKLSQLKDPFTIRGMEVATERLAKAFASKEKVCIYADFDLDGTSGLALLYEGLKTLGFPNLQYYQPKRLAEGYGFHPHVVEDLSRQEVGLIVTVDVGITALEAVHRANALKVDVIVTDHHQPAKELPSALAVVNPNQVGDTSGLGYLCGAGVAFYLLRGVQRKLVQNGLIEKSNLDLKVLLDFLTIGTLTDLVPLVGDNRPLVKAGLTQLENTQRPGLKALLEALQLSGRALSGQDVAIRFAPKLNALSRLENGLLPVDIFLVADEKKARDLVTSVLSSNEDRIQLQQDGERQALERLANWEHTKFVFVTSPDFHRGVIGLIATKLAQQFNCPAFVGSENEEGLIVGSSRVPQSGEGSVLRALQSASPFLNRFGGHHSASGFELLADNKSHVIESLKKHFEEFAEVDRTIEQEYDFEISGQDISISNMKWLDTLGPFGQGFAVPQFVLRNQKIKSVKDLRGGHLKLVLQNENENITALYFSPPSTMVKPVMGDWVDVLGELQWNYFAGSRTIQFLIRDIVASEGTSHEISRSVELRT